MIASIEGWSKTSGTLTVELSIPTRKSILSGTVLMVDPGTTEVRLATANDDIRLGQTVRGAGVPLGATVRRITRSLGTSGVSADLGDVGKSGVMTITLSKPLYAGLENTALTVLF